MNLKKALTRQTEGIKTITSILRDCLIIAVVVYAGWSALAQFFDVPGVKLNWTPMISEEISAPNGQSYTFTIMNDHEREFQVNFELTEEIVKKISEVEGVERFLWFSRYRIGVTKAELFSWEEVQPLIINALIKE